MIIDDKYQICDGTKTDIDGLVEERRNSSALAKT